MRKRKQSISYLLILVILSIGLVGCDISTDGEGDFNEVIISGASSVSVDSTITLSATVDNEGYDIINTKWVSGDEEIATVSLGVVTGVAEGSVDITVYIDNAYTTKTITVTSEGSVDSGDSGSSDNLVTNGDFSSSSGWSLQNSSTEGWGTGLSEVSYSNGAAEVTISSGGLDNTYEIALFTHVSLIEGNSYTVSFDYSASEAVDFGFNIQKEQADYASYIGDGEVALSATTEVQKYELTFTSKGTDSAAKLAILLSKAPTGSVVTIDNVKLVNNSNNGDSGDSGNTGDSGDSGDSNNLVTNGDFSSNSNSGWTEQDSDGNSWGGSGGDATFDYSGETAAVTIVQGDSSVNYEIQLSQLVSLESGESYTISFDYSATEDSTVEFEIQHATNYNSYLSGLVNVTATTTSQTYTETFTPSETNTEAKLVFLLSKAPTGSIVTIDNVTLVKNSSNLIINGDFSLNDNTGWTELDSDGGSWGGSGGDVTFDYSNGKAAVTIVQGDSSVAYEAQIYQSVSLEVGESYTISFDYSATEDSTVEFEIQHESNYNSYLSSGLVNVTANTTSQTYTETFTASETNATAKLVFFLSKATTGSVVTIDNVSLLKN